MTTDFQGERSSSQKKTTDTDSTALEQYEGSDWQQMLAFSHNKAKIPQVKLSGGTFRPKEHTSFHARNI